MRIFCSILLFTSTYYVCYGAQVFTEGSKIELRIPNEIDFNNVNDYREIKLSPHSVTTLKLSNYNDDIGFALIQLNSFEYNITLSYNQTFVPKYHLNGTNLGLVAFGNSELYAFNHDYDCEVWVSLILMLYNKTAPIPGGCNLDLPVHTSPILVVSVNEAVVEVDTPAGSVAKTFQKQESNICGNNSLTYETYYITMPSYDYTQVTYFEYIKKMLSYESILKNSHVNLLETFNGIKRKYDKQVGRGMVYATVVVDKTNHGYAVYVPAQTYSCEPYIWSDDCYEFNVPLRILATVISIIMVLEIIAGFMPLPIKGFLCGGVVGAISAIKFLQWMNANLGQEGTIACIAVAGIVFAIVFVCLSIGAPIVMLIFCNFITAFLLSSIIFTCFVGNYYNIFSVNVYLIISAMVIGTLTLTVPYFMVINAVTFAAFTLFYAMNTIFSGRLHYSIKHFYHNMYVDNYHQVLSPTSIESNEIMVLTMFPVLMALCLYLRYKFGPKEDSERKSCIKACCYKEEYAELTFEAVNRDTVPTITRWTDGDDDVFESPESNNRFFRMLSPRL